MFRWRRYVHLTVTLTVFSLCFTGGLLSCEDTQLCTSPADCAEGYICDLDGYCTQLTAYVRCGDQRCFAPEVCVDETICMVVDRVKIDSGNVDVPLSGIEASPDQGLENFDDGMSAGQTEDSDVGNNGGLSYVDFSVRDMSVRPDMMDDPLIRDQGGQGCQTACDCPNGLSCSAGMCISATEPVYCCQSSFCPPGQACQTESGARDLCVELSCQTACDCNTGLSCINGACVLDNQPLYCCDQGSCPSGGVCESARGVRDMCPADPCTNACDCTPGQRCVEGSCILEGDPLFCCDQGVCPSGEGCQTSAGAVSVCGGESICQTACDCMPGMSCLNGTCSLGERPIFCCEENLCPTGERCESNTGGPPGICGE